jgi:hypothetical protein
MPELDYVILADYVRQDGGLTHIMGGGIDTFALSAVPARVPVGVAVRISFASDERAGTPHRVQLSFQGPDGPLTNAVAGFATPEKQPGTPGHWPSGLAIILKLAFPIPAYGDYYSLEVSIDGDPAMSKSIDVRAVPVPGPPMMP